MILATLLLLSGLTISGVAIYYSVMGLIAIFSAAAFPIMIMGISLEVGKLVIASWIKAQWERIPVLMKIYGVTAVTVLMVITSLGIFGFLSKAHSDQTLVSGDVQAKIAIYDEKIQTAKENIEADRKQLRQMDEAVDQIMARSDSEKGAEKATVVRKSQQRDRGSLAKDIEANQVIISRLNEESAPVRAENRKVEAEVGPIKYIAAFVYGANPDSSILERAVTWVIILIVIVFDPLAVVMLLASQMTFQWIREDKKKVVEEHTSGEMTKDTQTETSNGLVGEPLPESLPTPIVEPINTNENDVMAIVNPEEIPNFTPHALTQEEMDALDEVSIADHDEEIIEPTSEDDVYLERIKEIPVDLEIEPEDIQDMERPGDYVTPPVVDVPPVQQQVAHAMPHPGRKSRGVANPPVPQTAPNVQAQPDNVVEELGTPSKSDFGNEFPINPEKGDTFLRVDYLPNRLFKFNGQKWIQIDKEQTDIYAYNDMYIKHLIDEIDSGRYETQSLTDVEREQIAHYLSKK